MKVANLSTNKIFKINTFSFRHRIIGIDGTSASSRKGLVEFAHS
jgi:hypothetical protein